MSDGKFKFPRLEAEVVAGEIVLCLSSYCERIIVAGSLRRGKKEVGDVEILYIPKTEKIPANDELFCMRMVERNLADEAIKAMLGDRILEKRLNVDGREAWGEKNKLALHSDTGIPVDLFACTEANWFNYLVCRTGGAQNNVRICNAAIERGWKWNPYGEGFSRRRGISSKEDLHRVRSEREVFEFVGLDYLEPESRQ